MKIGIFGHSAAKYRNHKNGDHYSQLVNAHFINHTINWYGFMCSSLERIVYQVNKHKNFDLYVIFHTDPFFLYFPGWSRDFSTHEVSDALSSDKGWQRFLTKIKNYPDVGATNNLNDKLEFFKDVIYNERINSLRYHSNLFLLKSLLANKKTIHIKHSGHEAKIFDKHYFSTKIAGLLTHQQPSNNEIFSKALISEIEKVVNS